MLDAKGVLNPGLMPQRLEDLRLLAPARDDVDDVLVERWNRVTEVWRNEIEFRTAVLRYATSKAHRDPASSAFWPEVVYPLIERARWHRRIRTRTEAVWDYVCGTVCTFADAGVVLDRALDRAVPAPLVAQLDDAMNCLSITPGSTTRRPTRFGRRARRGGPPDRLARPTASVSLVELAAERPRPTRTKGLLPLADPDPLRFFRGSSTNCGKRRSRRSRASPGPARCQAGQPPPCSGRSLPAGRHPLDPRPGRRPDRHPGHDQQTDRAHHPDGPHQGIRRKPLLAVWVYSDNSLAIVHLDFMNTERYVLWHAPRGHQLNFDEAADFNHELYALGMEIPDQLDNVLSRCFKPRKTR